MKRRIAGLVIVALLIGQGGVRATTAEALRLTRAMAEITVVLTDVNTGLDHTLAADRAVSIRDDTIGPVAAYSAECVPVALYTWTAVDMVASALLSAADGDWSMSTGWTLLVLAAFIYPSTPDNRFAAALEECAGGL